MCNIKFFTSEEMYRLWNIIQEDTSRHRVRNEAMIRIAYDCALRVSELLMLRQKDYNQHNKEIYCKRLKNGNSNTLKLVNAETIEVFELYLKQRKAASENDYIFVSQKNKDKPISRQSLDVIFKNFCSAAGIEDRTKWHMHSLRHTRAIELAELGADLKDLQHYLGHKHIDTTLIYFQYTSTQYSKLLKMIKKSSYGKNSY